MKSRKLQSTVATLILVSLLLGSFSPVLAGQEGPDQAGQIFLRLKYATFDPLQGEPAMDAGLYLDAYPQGEQGAYIVQFQGPILESWKEAIHGLGGQVLDYLPDYASIVWMDEAIREEVASLEAVRWVGVYQPAYKISPNLDGDRPVYRVVLFEPAARADVEARLQDLGQARSQLQGRQFAIVLPEGGTGVEALAAWPEVAWIESYPQYRTYNDVAAGIMAAPTSWANGYNGSGMMVTVADTGIDSGTDDGGVTGDIHPDFDNRVAHIRSWPVSSDPCWTNPGANDGAADVSSGHGSHVIGSVGGNGSASAGQFKGLAHEATLTFQAVEQYTTVSALCGGGAGYTLSGIPLDLRDLFQEAYGWGSRIHSNSWGADVYGEYTSDSQAVDDFMWQNPNMLILFAAGNAGSDGNLDGYVDLDSIGSPATAKNALVVGASDNERSTGGISTYTWYDAWPSDFPINPTRDDLTSDDRDELAAFSSRGPTDDGRFKPDVVAPGTNILSVRSQFATGSGWGLYNTYYMYMGGTSMATPLVAGAATLVREYYVEGQAHTPSAALIKATMINSAADIAGYGNPSREAGLAIPNNHEGWGRVNVGASTTGSRRFEDGDTVTTSGNQTYNYQIGLPSVPFKATLVWSDYPANPGASPALVNNLNLVVTAPGGAVYRGNNFSGGWSSTGGTADTVNNVESVYVPNPAAGQWSVRVEGANVPQGPQPFALVVTGYF
ncbi:MAG: S8 family serine peptidase, partial [Anaerolineae bacterium]